MQKLRTVSAGIITLILIATGISPMFAQSDAARLQGIITDQSSALVPGAKVQVTDLSTNRVLETTSAPDSGAWSFPVLPPGNYVLQVSMDGFKPIKQNVTLQVAQVANVNFVLEPGGVSEQLVVTADAALVDSASSDIGTTVETRQIKDLPLNGRNFTQLATLIPGVNRGVPGNVASGQGNNAETFRYGTSNGASLVVNGARPQANNFTLDGLDNNESMVNTIVFFPSAEAIEEFKVQTNIAPAEFGRAGGAIVNTTLKSGSNEIHGSAFEFIRNDNVDARPTFAPGISEFRRNQFGGAIGSPIIKNKLFVFGDYQGFRQSTPVGVDFASVPTTLMRQGNFSELLNAAAAGLSQPYVIRNVSTGAPFAGNIIPSNLQNPVGLNYLKAFPMPNIAGKVQQNYVVQRQQTQNFDDFDVRADWNATQGDRFFARASYAHDKEDTSTRLPGLPAGYGSGSQFTYAHGGALGYTHTFTPALFSDLRLGFQRTNMGYLPPYSDVPLSKNMGIPNANTSSLLGGGALIGGYNSQLEYTGDYGNYQVPENTFQGAGSLSWAKGNHLFKFGANVIRREVNLFRPKAGKGYFFLWGNGVGPGSTGYETADVLAHVQNYQIGAQTGMFGTRSWENAFFVQNGAQPPSHAEFRHSLRHTHQSDRSRRTTVQLRPADGLVPGCQRQPGSAGNWMTATGALPAAGFTGLSLTNPQNISVAAIKPDSQTSMMEQWNLQVQHQLPQSVVVSAAYVGAAGRHLVSRYNLANQLFNTPAGTHLYPGMGSVDVQDARGNSIYHSLQAEASRRFSNGLQFTAAYTFSKTIDQGSGAFATEQIYQSLRLDRALADTDVRNRFVFSGVYELPLGHGKRFANSLSKPLEMIVGGWQMNTILTVQSGLPFTLTTPGSPSNARPDLIGKLDIHPGNTQRYFDTNAVAAAPTNSSGVLLRQGTLGRNSLIGPGTRTVDLSMAKTTPIKEHFKLEFRAEAFNLFNHPVYSNPNTDISAGNFGQITGTQMSSERQLQGVIRLVF